MKLSDIRKGSVEDGDSGNSPDDMPSWLDIERFKNGQRFHQKHIAVCVLSMYISMLVGFSINHLLASVVFTKMSDTPEKALRRYVDTLRHLLLWFTGNVWDSSDHAYKSVQTVRKMHARVARSMNSKRAEKWSRDTDHGGAKLMYVSQYDMSVVQSGVMGLVVMYPEELGIKCSRAELEDVVHFWRGLGYLLGIKDKYNLCSGGYDQAYSLCKEIERDMVVPGLINRPKDFDLMSDAYVDGLNIPPGFKLFSKESIIELSRISSGWDMPPLKLSIADSLRVWFLRIFMFLVRWVPGFEALSNELMRRTLRFMMHRYLHKTAEIPKDM